MATHMNYDQSNQAQANTWSQQQPQTLSGASGPMLGQSHSGNNLYSQDQFQQQSSVPLVPSLNIPGPDLHMQPYQPPVAMSDFADDFNLLDVIGGSATAVMHPSKPVVAYSAGCIIIVFIMTSDTKMSLVGHAHDVHDLQFSPTGDLLVSIDFNRNESTEEHSPMSSIMVWDWAKGLQLQKVRAPSSFNPSMAAGVCHSKRFQICFDRSGATMLVLDSSGGSESANQGYRVSVWNFDRNQSLGLICHEDLETQQGASSIAILKQQTSQTTLANPLYNKLTGQITMPPNGNTLAQVYLTSVIDFVTLEKGCIKIWHLSQGTIELKKRVHIKQAIKQCIVADLTGFLLVLGENGKVLVLDAQGEFVSTVAKQGIFFSSLGQCGDKLLLGTERGTVQAYHLASLQFVGEVPYQMSLLENNCLNGKSVSENIRNAQKMGRPMTKVEEALLQVGPPVAGIMNTVDQRYLMIKYSDSSFVVVNRTIKSPCEAILGAQFGHFETITGLEWMGFNPGQSNPLVQDTQNQLVGQANESFVTCSHDLSVYIWTHFGDRWSHQYIDVAKCFNEGLTYKRKNCDKSTKQLQLTALKILPRRQHLAVADNKGTLRIFQLGQEQASLLSSYKLQRSPDLVGDITTAIESVNYTSNDQIAIITYDTGLVSAFDVRAGYQWLGDIEKEVPRIGQFAPPGNITKVCERYDAAVGQFHPMRSQQTKFSTFSIKAPNCIRQQSVEVRDNKMSAMPQAQFFISEGKITGFDLHPSKDYILVTSNKGKLYVFRIDTGELRGRINIPQHAQGCVIDPSGLYVVVKVPPYSPKYDDQTGEYSGFEVNEKDLCRSTIVMYEIGSGKMAAEVRQIFDIGVMKFSNCGRYLALGAKNGQLNVWSIGDHLFRAINEVIQNMRQHPDFWNDFPLVLPEVDEQPPTNDQLQQQQLADLQNAMAMSQHQPQQVYHQQQPSQMHHHQQPHQQTPAPAMRHDPRQGTPIPPQPAHQNQFTNVIPPQNQDPVAQRGAIYDPQPRSALQGGHDAHVVGSNAAARADLSQPFFGDMSARTGEHPPTNHALRGSSGIGSFSQGFPPEGDMRAHEARFMRTPVQLNNDIQSQTMPQKMYSERGTHFMGAVNQPNFQVMVPDDQSLQRDMSAENLMMVNEQRDQQPDIHVAPPQPMVHPPQHQHQPQPQLNLQHPDQQMQQMVHPPQQHQPQQLSLQQQEQQYMQMQHQELHQQQLHQQQQMFAPPATSSQPEFVDRSAPETHHARPPLAQLSQQEQQTMHQSLLLEKNRAALLYSDDTQFVSTMKNKPAAAPKPLTPVQTRTYQPPQAQTLQATLAESLQNQQNNPWVRRPQDGPAAAPVEEDIDADVINEPTPRQRDDNMRVIADQFLQDKGVPVPGHRVSSKIVPSQGGNSSSFNGRQSQSFSNVHSGSGGVGLSAINVAPLGNFSGSQNGNQQAFTLTQLRQQEKKLFSFAASISGRENASFIPDSQHEQNRQRVLEEDSERSKTSLIDQAYKDIDDFEQKLEDQRIRAHFGPQTRAAPPQNYHR